MDCHGLRPRSDETAVIASVARQSIGAWIAAACGLAMTGRLSLPIAASFHSSQ